MASMAACFRKSGPGLGGTLIPIQAPIHIVALQAQTANLNVGLGQ